MKVPVKNPHARRNLRPEADLSDEELLITYRETGDREIFARLVHRYERELFSYLRRYVGNAEMAEDAFQATFLQIHLKCDQFEEGRKFRPWMYTIATNQAIDAQRRNRRHRMVSLDQSGGQEADDVGKLIDLLVSSDVDPLERVDEMERSQQMQEAVDELPDFLRTALQLVYYQGLKYREAAEVLDVPVGTVKSRIHTAILKLTESWKKTHVDQD